MKLKYSIVKIDSTADDVYVKSYGQDVFEFHKEDFNGDWQNIVGEEFNLDPCTAADLSKLEMYGNEAHNVNYSLEDKLNWYTFARNKIRDDFFTNTERLAEIDNTRDVQVYNKDIIDSTSKLKALLVSLPASLATIGLDLSTLKIEDEFTELEPEQGLLYDGTCRFSAGTLINSSSLFTYIHKFPNLPKNLKNLNSTFSNMRGLNDISNIDFSNIIKITSPFSSTAIEDLSNMDISNVLEITRLVDSCNKIKYLPKLDNINATKIDSLFINIPSTIEDVGDINILSENGEIYNWLFCQVGIKKVGNINIKSNLIGEIISACTQLEEIGNVNIDKVSIIDSRRANLITNLEAGASTASASSLRKIGNIHIKNMDSAVTTDILWLNNGEVSVGDITIDNNTRNSVEIYVPNGTIGNVSIGNSAEVINIHAKTVGVVCSETAPLYIGSVVKNIKAYPQYLNSNSYGGGGSSGFNFWFDYIATPTTYIKRIVNADLDISQHIGTPNKDYKDIINITNLISANPEYPYDFELEEYNLTVSDKYTRTLNTNNYTYSNMSKPTSVKLVRVDNQTLGLEVDLKDLVDGSTLTINKLNLSGLDIKFKAKIDGQDFYGKTHITLKGTIDFEVTEDISSNFHIEYEEGEEPIENSIE